MVPPTLLFQLGFLGAFSRELFDAGFAVAVCFGCEWRGSLFFYIVFVTDGWAGGLQYILCGCEDGLPVFEYGEGDTFSFAVCDEV